MRTVIWSGHGQKQMKLLQSRQQVEVQHVCAAQQREQMAHHAASQCTGFIEGHYVDICS